MLQFDRHDFLETFDKERGYGDEDGVVNYTLSTSDVIHLKMIFDMYDNSVKIVVTLPHSDHTMLDLSLKNIVFAKIKEVKRDYKVLCFFITDKDEQPALEIVIQPLIQLQHTMSLI